MAQVDIYQMESKENGHFVAPNTIYDAVINPLTKKTLDVEYSELYSNVGHIKGIQHITTAKSWSEVKIDRISSGTFIVDVITDVTSDVYAREDASGAINTAKITSGSTLGFDINYIVTSTPCNITIVYGEHQEIIKRAKETLNGITGASTNKNFMNSIIRDIVVYDSSFVGSDKYTIESMKKTTSYIMAQIKKNGTIVSTYYKGIVAGEKMPLLVEFEEYQSSGITAKAIIDWGSAPSNEIAATILNKNVNANTFISLIPSNENESGGVNGIIRSVSVNDNINNAVRELEVFDGNYSPSDTYSIDDLKKSTTAAQFSIRKNGAYVSSYYTTDVDNLPMIVEIDEFQSSGITARAIVNWDAVSEKGYYGAIYNSCVNTKYSAFGLQNTKWEGKNLLAIGDSVTAAKLWQKKVGDILGMNISTHAKGGIGIIGMVDGDGSGDAPQDYDPNLYDGTLYKLNSKDVEGKDYIVLFGFYNEVGITIGENTDMYPSQSTFKGKLNYAISRVYEELKEANNMTCKIVVATLHKCGKGEYRDYDGYDEKYAKAAKSTEEVAMYNSVYCIDLYGGSGINKYNWDTFQSSPTSYNQNYIPADGVSNGENKPFASLSNAPSASSNKNKMITIQGESGCYMSDGSNWVKKSNPTYPWLGDQLHPNGKGYDKIGEFIAGHLMNI